MAYVATGFVACLLLGSEASTGTTRMSAWKVVDLGTLHGASSEPTAINERGQVVGWSTTKTGKKHATLWLPR
jgi:probable HAF family extracellular repeat protein